MSLEEQSWQRSAFTEQQRLVHLPIVAIPPPYRQIGSDWLEFFFFLSFFLLLIFLFWFNFAVIIRNRFCFVFCVLIMWDVWVYEGERIVFYWVIWFFKGEKFFWSCYSQESYCSNSKKNLEKSEGLYHRQTSFPPKTSSVIF